jgi:hypothetical protein
MPKPTRPIILLAAVVVVVALAFLIVTLVRGSGGSPHDPALRRTAARIVPLLNHPSGKLPITDDSLRSFQAWVYDSEPSYLTARKRVPRGQFIQVVYTDPRTLPPQVVTLAKGSVRVALDGATLQKVAQGSGPRFTSVAQAKQSYRAYVVKLHVPAALVPAGSTALLEVLTRS